MKYIQCPDSLTNGDLRKDCLFLAGGITGCPDWQSEMKKLLRPYDLVVVNPRRVIFDKSKVTDEEQITWERLHMRNCNIISFWFPKETLCPITLLELGYWLRHCETNPYPLGGIKLFIGCEDGYQRKNDVKIQAGLSIASLTIADSIEDLTNQVISHINRER